MGCSLWVFHRYSQPTSLPITGVGMQVLKPQNNTPTGLAPGAMNINLNSKILPLYLHTILPNITDTGDDGHYGSSAMLDVLTLQVCPSTTVDTFPHSYPLLLQRCCYLPLDTRPCMHSAMPSRKLLSWHVVRGSCPHLLASLVFPYFRRPTKYFSSWT